MTKDAFYFPHDSNARNDQRILKLRYKHGASGYGAFFMLLEIMRETGDYRLKISDLEYIDDMEIHIGVEVLKDIVKNYDLFVVDMCIVNGDGERIDGYIYSDSFNRRMDKMNDLRHIRAKAGRKGGKAQAKPKQTVSKSKALKETKLDKIKLNKKKSNNGFDHFWNLYDKKVGDLKKVVAKWDSLSNANRNDIFKHITDYIKATPDKSFRKNPMTYLNNSGWTDEIIKRNGAMDKADYQTDTTGFPMAWCEKCNISSSYKWEQLNGESRCCNAGLMNRKRETVNV